MLCFSKTKAFLSISYKEAIQVEINELTVKYSNNLQAGSVPFFDL